MANGRVLSFSAVKLIALFVLLLSPSLFVESSPEFSPKTKRASENIDNNLPGSANSTIELPVGNQTEDGYSSTVSIPIVINKTEETLSDNSTPSNNNILSGDLIISNVTFTPSVVTIVNNITTSDNYTSPSGNDTTNGNITILIEKYTTSSGSNTSHGSDVTQDPITNLEQKKDTSTSTPPPALKKVSFFGTAFLTGVLFGCVIVAILGLIVVFVHRK